MFVHSSKQITYAIKFMVEIISAYAAKCCAINCEPHIDQSLTNRFVVWYIKRIDVHAFISNASRAELIDSLSCIMISVSSFVSLVTDMMAVQSTYYKHVL